MPAEKRPEDARHVVRAVIAPSGGAQRLRVGGSMPGRILHCCAFIVLLLVGAQPAAAFVSVGPAPCAVPTVQEAISAIVDAERNDGDYGDPYIVVANGTYFESLEIDGTNIGDPRGAFVVITGGYDDVCDRPAGTPTQISAGRTGGNSVLEISGNATVYLHDLIMSDATGGVKKGGGINFHGRGSLDLFNVDLSYNSAEVGAGISTDGDSAGISLSLHGGTSIHNNVASARGGGLAIGSNSHLYMLEDAILVADNRAATSGGGLFVSGANSDADVGTPGWFGRAVLDGNSALDGGGVTVQDRGIVRLFATVPGAPPRIENNEATNRGGGVFVDAQNDGQTHGTFCAYGYGINGNTAGIGAAIEAASSGDGSVGGLVYLQRESLNTNVCGTQLATELGFIGCPGGAVCNSISNNGSARETLFVADQAAMYLDRVEMHGNTTSNFLISSSGLISFRNCLLSDNHSPLWLLATAEGGRLTVDGCTIANNASSGASPLLFLDSDSIFTISSTVISSTVATVERLGGSLNVQDVIATETDSLTTNSISSNVLKVSDPGFIDPAHDNYHLLSTSPAVDFAESSDLATDLDGNPRGKDLLPATNRAGAFDIGAYELQTYTPPPPCFENDKIFCNGFGG